MRLTAKVLITTSTHYGRDTQATVNVECMLWLWQTSSGCSWILDHPRWSQAWWHEVAVTRAVNTGSLAFDFHTVTTLSTGSSTRTRRTSSPRSPLRSCELHKPRLPYNGSRPPRGGATVLKVGAEKFCERSEQKIFLTPPFLASGGQNTALTSV